MLGPVSGNVCKTLREPHFNLAQRSMQRREIPQGSASSKMKSRVFPKLCDISLLEQAGSCSGSLDTDAGPAAMHPMHPAAQTLSSLLFYTRVVPSIWRGPGNAIEAGEGSEVEVQKRLSARKSPAPKRTC